jgi:hypothetical protein
VDYFTRQLDAHPGLDPAAHTAINHTNAAALLPDLKPINAGF